MRRTDTRSRLLDLAEVHLMQHGYHGFSFRDLARTLEIQPPAVHYHFRTKPELVVAAVHRYGQRFQRWTELVADHSPAEQLLSYVALGQAVVRDGRTCALGMLQAEMATLPEVVHTAVLDVYQDFLAFYTSRLAAARQQGAAQFTGAPEVAAELLGCTLVGAQHMSRTMGEAVYQRVMQAQTRQLGLMGAWPRPPQPPRLDGSAA
jgi:TetR/AcrR family transcriptional repressor of nem operon